MEKSINQFLASVPNETECLQYLEKIRWNGIVVSPFSPNSKVYYCKDGKYKCRDSGKYFNAKTGTMFHHSRISLQKWFAAIWMMAIAKNAITSVDMAKELQITQKSAWYMMQRIREYFNLKKTSVPRKKKASAAETVNEISNADKLNMVEWLKMLKQ